MLALCRVGWLRGDCLRRCRLGGFVVLSVCCSGRVSVVSVMPVVYVGDVRLRWCRWCVSLGCVSVVLVWFIGGLLVFVWG